MKSVMVYYCVDREKMHKEPLGVLIERRKEERGNNDVGMLRLAREEFAGTVKDPSRIVIGDSGLKLEEVVSTGVAPPFESSPFVPCKPSLPR